MNKKVLRTGLALLVVLVAMVGTAYAADSSAAPEGFNSISGVTQINPGTEGVKKILLIEDQLPWGYNSNSLALAELKLTADKVNLLGLPNVVWNDYSLIIVASDQPQSLYTALAPLISPGGVLYNWVNAGGVLNFHGAAWGWQGSDWTLAFKLPGGISAVNNYTNDVTVIGPATPLPPAKGPFKAITDADLDNWNYASHGYLKYVGGDTPPSVVVITLKEAGAKTNPVYAIYKFGSGAVLTSLQPLEWAYAGGSTINSKYALLNDIDGGRKIDNLIS